MKMDRHTKIFIYTAFAIQVVLVLYFTVRKIDFNAALHLGWIVYSLAIPAIVVSIMLLAVGKPWYLWLAGFAYGIWAILGYVVDVVLPISWRSPIYYPVFIPYVLLYTTSQMFYWWPLGKIKKTYWYGYLVLFAISTFLNITSHSW
jgi:hypothetical protein